MNLDEILQANIASRVNHGAGLTEMIDRNLAQTGGNIGQNLLHMTGVVGISNTMQSDDAQSIAGLQTAASAPKQGAIGGGGT